MDKIHTEKLIIYGYINQQNNVHECHCIGTVMNRTPDILTWSQTFQPLCYLDMIKLFYHSINKKTLIAIKHLTKKQLSLAFVPIYPHWLV